MINFKLFSCSASLSLLGLMSLLINPVAAQEFKPKEAGDFVIRVRGISAIPNEEVDLSVGGSSIPGDADLGTAYAPELDFSYFLTNNLALELIAAVTTHSVEAKGTPLGDVDLGKVGLVPPTLTLQYHFLTQERFSPYLGAGINYTFFFTDEDGDADNIEYDNSFGFALQAGFDYAVSGGWSVNVDVKKLFLNTEAEIRAAGIDIEADVDVDPWIIGIGIGYRF